MKRDSGARARDADQVGSTREGRRHACPRVASLRIGSSARRTAANTLNGHPAPLRVCRRHIDMSRFVPACVWVSFGSLPAPRIDACGLAADQQHARPFVPSRPLCLSDARSGRARRARARSGARQKASAPPKSFARPSLASPAPQQVVAPQLIQVLASRLAQVARRAEQRDQGSTDPARASVLRPRGIQGEEMPASTRHGEGRLPGERR